MLRATAFTIGFIVGALGVYSLATRETRDTVPSHAFGAAEKVLPGEESLFAEIGPDGDVLRVIVVDAEVIASGVFGPPENWVRTYANGRGRGQYAGKGDIYDRDADTFKKP